MTKLNKDALHAAIAENFDARIEFEASKNNEKLKLDFIDMKARVFKDEKLLSDCVKRQFTFDFVNASQRKDARFNAKAVLKTIDLLSDFAHNRAIRNACTRAIVAQAKHASENAFTLTSELCKATLCSAIEASERAKLNRAHIRNMSAATASSQASSSIAALVAARVCETETLDNRNARVSVNLDDKRMTATLEALA